VITVSTISEREARVAAGALGAHVPADIGWSVYLRGTLFRERQVTVPVSRPDLSWANPEEQR
jgi:hypothetical protein